MVTHVEAAIETPFRIDGHVLTIGGSVGSCLVTDSDLTAHSAMRHADAAMYRRKTVRSRAMIEIN